MTAERFLVSPAAANGEGRRACSLGLVSPANVDSGVSSLARGGGSASGREWLARVELYIDGRYARVVKDAAFVDIDTGEIVEVSERIGDRDGYEKAAGQLQASSIGVVADRDSGRKASGRKGGSEHSTKVHAFSRAARKRLLDNFNKLSRKMVVGDRVAFITLTYGDDAPVNPEQWKRDFHTLRKRMDRNEKWGHHSAVWRMEVKPRQSGTMAGQPVAHFHLVVFGLGRGRPVRPSTLKRELLDWLPDAWSEISGASREGTDIQIESKVKRIFRYLSKYVSKVEKDTGCEMPEGVGRLWGYLHRDRLPWSVMVVGYIHGASQSRVVAFFKHLNGVPEDSNKAFPSISAYLSPMWFLGDWLPENDIPILFDVPLGR